MAEAANAATDEPPGLIIIVTTSQWSMRKGSDYLNSIGIPTTAVYSDHRRDPSSTIQSVLEGKFHVLYLSELWAEKPSQSVKRLMSYDRLRLFVYDIPERPFQKKQSDDRLSTRLLEGKCNTVCLADTTDPAVISGICQDFQVPESSVFSQPHLPSRDIELQAFGVERRHDKFPILVDILNRVPGPTFVYTKSGQTELKIASRLKRLGYDATAMVVNDYSDMSTNSGTPRVYTPAAALKHDIVVTRTTGFYHPHVRHIIFYDSLVVKNMDRRMRNAGRDVGSTCTALVCAQEQVHSVEGALSQITSIRTCRDMIAAQFTNKDGKKHRQGSMLPISVSQWTWQYDVEPDVTNTIFELLEHEEKYLKLSGQCPNKIIYGFTTKGDRYSKLFEKNVLAQAITQHSRPNQRGAFGTMPLMVDFFQIYQALGIHPVRMINTVSKWVKQGLLTFLPVSFVAMYELTRDAPDENEINRLARIVHSRMGKLFHGLQKLRRSGYDVFTSERCFVAGL